MGGLSPDEHGEPGEEILQVEVLWVLLPRLCGAGLRHHGGVGAERRVRGVVHAGVAAVPGEEEQAVVRPEDLLPDACKEAVAVVLREVLDLPLEPDVHRLKVVQVKRSYFAGDDTEKFSFCRRPLHPAAGCPDGVYRYRSFAGVLHRIDRLPREGVDEEGAGVARAGSGRAAAFPADESQETIQERMEPHDVTRVLQRRWGVKMFNPRVTIIVTTWTT